MSEMWSYDKVRRFDYKGRRWHFVLKQILEAEVYEDQPYELYFRNDEETEFGLLLFEMGTGNSYRNYEILVNKIMNDDEFRKTLLDSETQALWHENWK